jgi:hypothetical protein
MKVGNVNIKTEILEISMEKKIIYVRRQKEDAWQRFTGNRS